MYVSFNTLKLKFMMRSHKTDIMTNLFQDYEVVLHYTYQPLLHLLGNVYNVISKLNSFIQGLLKCDTKR